MAVETAAAPAATVASPKKSATKKKTGTAKPKAAKGQHASHPTYQAMIKAAVIALKEKKGSSRAALLKYIVQHYKVGENLAQINAHLRLSLKRGVQNGSLKQMKGTGASGSFRLGDSVKTAKSSGAKKRSKSPKKAGATKKARKAPAAAG